MNKTLLLLLHYIVYYTTDDVKVEVENNDRLVRSLGIEPLVKLLFAVVAEFMSLLWLMHIFVLSE